MGVFATREIERGTKVIAFNGRSRQIWEIPERFWDHCFQVDYDTYVVPRSGSFGWYVNHSCEPNCVIRGERELESLRKIRKGDELAFDYSTNVGWDGFVMACCCGSENCRRTILSYARLGEETRRKYGEMVSPFLLRGKEKPKPSLF